MKWRCQTGWHCGFIHKILVLQETWSNPEGSMGGSVCLLLTCSDILAQKHVWVLSFPHSFQLPELRGYGNSPASWSRIIGLPSPGSFFSPLQLPQYPSMSLFIGLIRQYLIDDYATCFLILSLFSSSCFSYFWMLFHFLMIIGIDWLSISLSTPKPSPTRNGAR